MPEGVEIKIYSTLVYVPTRTLIQHYFGPLTIQEYRDTYRKLMDAEKDPFIKKDYETCVIVLEKAINHGGKLNCTANLCINNAGIGIKFHFDFDNIHNLLNFKKSMDLISGSGTIV